MSDTERIAALEHQVAVLRSDLAALGAQLALVKATAAAKAPKMAIRGGQPVVG